MTRCSDLGAEQIEARRQRIRRLAANADLPVHPCEHAASAFLQQPGGQEEPAVAVSGRRVVLLSAIARPDSYRRTGEGLGGQVGGELRYRDHHRFMAAEAEAAASKAKALDALLLTTEKDDVKLDGFDVERGVLRISLRFLERSPVPSEFML